MGNIVKLQGKKRRTILKDLLHQLPGIPEVLGVTKDQLSHRRGMLVFQSSTFDTFALHGCGVEKNYLFIPFSRRGVKSYLILTSTFQEDMTSTPRESWSIEIIPQDKFFEEDFLRHEFRMGISKTLHITIRKSPHENISLKGIILLDKLTLALINMVAKTPPSK